MVIPKTVKEKSRGFWFSLLISTALIAYIGFSSYQAHKCNLEFNGELSARARIADEDTKLRLQFWQAVQNWADKKAKNPFSEQPNINQVAAVQLDEIVSQAVSLLEERTSHPLPPTQCGADNAVAGKSS